MKYEVVTTPYADGRIEQRTDYVDEQSGIRDEICRWVLDTQESAVREALIRLGWTPPAVK